MLADLNATRASAGLPALQLDAQLCDDALSYAQEMANRHFFSHTSPDGRTFAERMRYSVFTVAGENIGMGHSEPSVYQALIHSPHHFANIVDRSFSKVGLGIVRESDGTMIFVQDFTD